MADERSMRTCNKTSCRWPAAASLSYRYDMRHVWLVDLAEEADPSLYDLCPHHAETLVVMRGWEFVDERTHAEPVAEPAGRDLLPESGRPPVGARGYGHNRYSALVADLPRLAAMVAAEQGTAEAGGTEGSQGTEAHAGAHRAPVDGDEQPGGSPRTGSSRAVPPRGGSHRAGPPRGGSHRAGAPRADDGTGDDGTAPGQLPKARTGSHRATPSATSAAPGGATAVGATGRTPAPSPARHTAAPEALEPEVLGDGWAGPPRAREVPGQLAIPVPADEPAIGEAVVVSINTASGRRRATVDH
jgi:hypothetical protein